VIRAVAVALLGCLVVSCGGQGPTAAAPTAVTATLERSRLFETDRALRATFENPGAGAVVVEDPRLDWDLFEAVAGTGRAHTVPAGGTTGTIRLRYGRARCDAASSSRPVVVATVGGVTRRLRVRVDQAEPILRVHAAECAAARLAGQVSLRLGPGWRPAAGQGVEVDLELVQREAGTAVTVVEVAGSVIFSVTGLDPVAARVDDGRTRAVVPLVVRADRCDPHALIESKRTYVFPAWVQVGDDEPVRVELRPEPVVEEALAGLLGDCLDA
jgi:hypothetical protein